MTAAPVRGVAVYVWVIVTANTAAWLGRIVPAIANGRPPAFLRGTGLAGDATRLIGGL